MVGRIIGLSLLCIGGYLVGGIFGAKIFSKLKGGDISKMGSGNPGAMNMVRNYGAWLALCTMLFDIFKAVIFALAGWFILKDVGLYIAGFSVMLGHAFPIWYHFKGGKCISCAFGIFAVANPLVGIPMVVLTIVMICITKQGAMCDLGYMLVMGIVETIMCKSEFAVVYVLIWLMVVLVFWTHRSNISRVLHGTENKTELGKEIKKAFTIRKKDKTEQTQENANDIKDAEPSTTQENVETKLE